MTAEPTYPFLLPFSLRIDNSTSYYLPADETKGVLVRPQRARRTERITSLHKYLVKEAIYHFDRHTPQHLDRIESHNLVESKVVLA